MSQILAALHRAMNRRVDVGAPVPVYLSSAPARLLPIVPVELRLTQAHIDDVMHAIGPYAGDPRITAVTDRRIRLDDGRTIDRIPNPDTDPYAARGSMWRMYRPDRTASAFWWPQPADALADVLGPAQLPTFTSLEIS